MAKVQAYTESSGRRKFREVEISSHVMVIPVCGNAKVGATAGWVITARHGQAARHTPRIPDGLDAGYPGLWSERRRHHQRVHGERSGRIGRQHRHAHHQLCASRRT
jgi:hypothetical protein